jgi:hypothetical protein
MAPAPNRPDSLEWQVFRGSDVVRQGLLTENQLRNSAWVHVRHDVYADARLIRDHALACRATALRLPAGAVMAGPSAAYLLGIHHAAGFADDVHVIVPPRSRLGRQRGVRVHAIDLDPHDRWTDLRLLRTSPVRTAWDVAIWLELTRAVGIIDTLLGRGMVTAGDLADFAARNAGRASSRQARWVFGLADGRARAPAESHLRIWLVTAGLPRALARPPIELPDGRVCHPTLAWPEYKVAVDHDEFTAPGWIVVHATGVRSHRDLGALVRAVRRALASRGWH